MKKIIPVIGIILGLGCGSLQPLIIPKTDPSPNVSMKLSEKKRSVSIVLADGILNEFEVSHKFFGGRDRVWKMTSYRDSLQAGFQNGFKDYFKIVPQGSPSDLIVEISRADFRFVIDTVNGFGEAVLVRPNIEYRAVLKKRNGEPVKISAATVMSKITSEFNYESGGIIMTIDPESIKSVIESMYEVMSKDMF